MRRITGLNRPRAGSTKVLGQEKARMIGGEWRRLQVRWGVLFQNGALFSSMTVAQNVQVSMKEHTALPQRLMDELAALKIELAGLPADAAGKSPAELSGGMRTRAGLARALALDPEILFLDAQTSGLDPIGPVASDDMI